MTSIETENKRNRDLRITCVDLATRVVGKPEYHLNKDGKVEKKHDDIVSVANNIYNFITKLDK